MKKQLLIMLVTLLSSVTTMWAQVETTYSPVLDVNFRTAAGNTAWNSGYPKSAADEGVTEMQLKSSAGQFALQKYTISDIQNATKLVLTLTVGSWSGVDAVRLWSIPVTNWTTGSGFDDIYLAVKAALGVDMRSTEGTPNEPLVKGAKVADSNPAKVTFTITGNALATIKSNAASDGTFTLLLTNDNLTSSSNQRSYLSNNTANAEANRPTLVATTTAPAPKTAKIGDTEYETLAEAFDAAVAADADATIEVSGDQKLTARLTWNKAHTLNIVPTADITIKGPKNAMWFLVNVNDAILNIGSTEHKMTFDGISDDRSTFTNDDVARRENNTQLQLTNIEFKDFNSGANHLISCKNSGGAITLLNIAMTNCSSTHALIDNQRVANDALILKGYLNIADDCSGVAINNVAHLQGSGAVEGRIKVADDNFTASKVITIKWVSSDDNDVFVANSPVVVGVTSKAIANCFALADAPEGWTLTRVNNDLKLTAPVEPTAKIGDASYADLAAALAAVQDGQTIILLDDQEIAARVNIKDMSITIKGEGKAIKRAAGYTNGMLFLTQQPSEDMKSELTLDGVIIDGQNVEASAIIMEASNNGTTTLKNVTIRNCVNTANTSKQNAIIVNKSGGRLILDGVTFENCTVQDGQSILFVGTNDVTLKGQNTIPSIYMEHFVLKSDNATVTSPVAIYTKDGRPYGMLVEGGDTKQFTCESFRLSQQQDGIYAMPLRVAANYSHPALLHNAADIATAKDRLNTAPYQAAYAALETASTGTAVGAVEYLKRMDQGNWGEIYPDFSNYTKAATDAKLAYELALRYQLKGSDAAATAAVNILNNWAATNKGMLRLTRKANGELYANSIPDPNEYLICIQAYQFANAAELLRGYNGWQTADFQQFQNWIRQTFADVAILFLENHHQNENSQHYWLNWDLAALNAMLSTGILCDDKALVDYVLNYVDNGQGTGNKDNAIVATHTDSDSEETLAQCQESGRDQGHSLLDVTLMGVLCQTAQNIGTDLWTKYKALEMAEYVGKYNLKNGEGFAYNNVPFTAYTNGEVTHSAISADGRGNERYCWELFHAYAKKNDKADKYAEAWVKYIRQKNAGGEVASTTADELGFGTLMFGAEVTPTAISTAKTGAAQVNMIEYFDLAGRKVQAPAHGIYVKTVYYNDGTSRTMKVVLK